MKISSYPVYFLLLLLLYPGDLIGAEKPLLKSSLPLPAAGALDNPRLGVFLKEVDRFQLNIPISSQVIDGTTVHFMTRIDNVLVKPYQKGILIGQFYYETKKLTIATHDQMLEVDGKGYRDNLTLILTDAGKLQLINDVNLEDYLKGVLPLEVHYDWPKEVLRAQAIASRTYALFKMLDRLKETHAVSSDVLSQVYGGMSAEKEETSRAVDATQGLVMTYGGQIFPAFFHANSGGRTTNAENVWAIEPNPVLTGVDSPMSASGKYETWDARIAFSDIEKKIKSHGYTMSPIKYLFFSHYDHSGRARLITIEHQKGWLELNANDFRLFVGADQMRSTRAIGAVEGAFFHVHGKGWGHGVGMCQWGAKSLAESGYDAFQILSFYYPGNTVQRLYGSESAGGSSDEKTVSFFKKLWGN